MELLSIWLARHGRGVLPHLAERMPDWRVEIMRHNADLLQDGDHFTVIVDDEETIDRLGPGPWNFVDATRLYARLAKWLGGVSAIHALPVNPVLDLFRIEQLAIRTDVVYLDTDVRLTTRPRFSPLDGRAFFAHDGRSPNLAVVRNGFEVRLFQALFDYVLADVESGSWPSFAIGLPGFERAAGVFPPEWYVHHRHGAGVSHWMQTLPKSAV